MTASIPVSLLEGWIHDLSSILKQESHEAKTGTDLSINQGMRHGVAQIRSRLNTWRRHQENMETLSRSGNQFLITKDVNLSRCRHRKLEWQEGDVFFVLAWRHGMNEEVGELMLEIQETRDLSRTFLVYTGGLSFDDLAGLARERRSRPCKKRGEPARVGGEGLALSLSWLHRFKEALRLRFYHSGAIRNLTYSSACVVSSELTGREPHDEDAPVDRSSPFPFDCLCSSRAARQRRGSRPLRQTHPQDHDPWESKRGAESKRETLDEIEDILRWHDRNEVSERQNSGTNRNKAFSSM